MRAAFLALLFPLLALMPPACSDPDEGPGPAATPPVTVGKCRYTIAPRPEYTDLFTPKDSGEAARGTTLPAPDFRRIRLGLGGNVRPDAPDRPDPSTSVAIAWETEMGVTASWVQYGTSPDPATWTDREFGISYVVPRAEKSPSAKKAPQQLHEVHLCGLKPSTTYHYRVGGGPEGQETWSDVLSFRTTPSPDADEEVTLAVTGDSRGNNFNAWQILQERLYKRGDVHAQLFSGDVVDLAFDQKAYEDWLDNAGRDTAGKRSMGGQVLSLVAMGNHELYNAQFFSTIVQPQDPTIDRKYDELFFSTNIGPVHVVVLDDERVGKPNTDKAYAPLLLGWLDADLGAVDRSKQPWVVVVHHRSEFSAASHGEDSDVLEVRKAFLPVWDRHKVNLILAGHDHNYERSKPIQLVGDTPTPGQGTRYIVCAGSGAEPYGNGKTEFTEVSTSYHDNAPEGARHTIGIYGILKATRARLSFTAYHLTPDNTDQEVDRLELP